jgi:hypothetical protein
MGRWERVEGRDLLPGDVVRGDWGTMQPELD